MNEILDKKLVQLYNMSIIYSRYPVAVNSDYLVAVISDCSRPCELSLTEVVWRGWRGGIFMCVILWNKFIYDRFFIKLENHKKCQM